MAEAHKAPHRLVRQYSFLNLRHLTYPRNIDALIDPSKIERKVSAWQVERPSPILNPSDVRLLNDAFRGVIK